MTSRNEKRRRRRRARVIALALCAALCGGIAVAGGNVLMVKSAEPRIVSLGEAAALEQIDCVLVLGAQVWDSGAMSHVLEDRMRMALELYDAGAAPVILASGDHGKKEYDEVAAMKQYAVDHGVPSQDVFMDHAGFSTYESMYRARDVFQARCVIVVTQRYHMARALYIARQLGLEAWGVASDYRTYASQPYMTLREWAARVKACVWCVFKPKPTYLGDPYPLNGNGDDTNGEMEVDGERVRVEYTRAGEEE